MKVFNINLYIINLDSAVSMTGNTVTQSSAARRVHYSVFEVYRYLHQQRNYLLYLR